MKLEHTSGPWSRGKNNGVHHDCIYGPDGIRVCAVQKEQDFNLIAAAPEMLEALIATVKTATTKINLEARWTNSSQYALYLKHIKIIEKASGLSWQEIQEEV